MGESVLKAFAAVPTLKSDGSNYRVWLQRVLVAALGCQCRKLLEADATSAAAQQDLADSLLSCLLGKLPDSLFMSISTSSTTPKDVMDAMAQRFGQSTTVTQAAAERQLYALRCEDEKKILAHLDRLLLVREEVTNAGATIDDTQFANIIMTSCPPSYDSVIQAYQQAINVKNATRDKDTEPEVKATSARVLALLRGEAQSRTAIRADRSRSTPRPKEEASMAADSRRGGKHSRPGKVLNGPDVRRSPPMRIRRRRLGGVVPSTPQGRKRPSERRHDASLPSYVIDPHR